MKIALEIMLYGMGGIFAALFVVMAVTYLLRFFDKMDQKKSSQ